MRAAVFRSTARFLLNAVCAEFMDPEIPLIQARLSHEDDLINQRISWLVNSQSFLLTAYAITLNGWRQIPGVLRRRFSSELLRAVADGGNRLRDSCGRGDYGRSLRLGELRRFAATKYPKDRLFVISKPTIQFLGVSAPTLIPIVFLVIWLAILRRLSRDPQPEGDEPPHLAMCIDPEGNEFMLTRKRRS